MELWKCGSVEVWKCKGSSFILLKIFDMMRQQQSTLALQSQHQMPRRRLRLTWLRHQRVAIGLSSLLLTLAIWACLAIQPPTTPGLQPGVPSPVSIQAERSVDYVSTWRTEQERTRAESNPTNIVYLRDINLLSEQRRQLDTLLQTITQIRNDPTLRPADEQLRLAALPSSTLVISPALASNISELSDGEWQDVRRFTLDFYDRAVSEYTFSIDEQALRALQSSSLPYWANLAVTDPNSRDIILLFTGSYLRTNLSIDEEATRNKQAEARASVKPVTVHILRGESIVRAGDVITPDIQEKLEALGELKLELNPFSVAGQGMLAGLIGLIFASFVWLTQSRDRLRLRTLLTIVGLCMLTLAPFRLITGINTSTVYVYPLAITALLVSTLFNRGLALFVTTLLTIPITLMAESNLALGAALLFGCMAGIFMIGRGERSLKFIVAGMTVMLTTFLTSIAFVLINQRTFTLEALTNLGILSVLNGAISAILALGLYNLVAHIAGIVTPIRLMELAHPAQPLIRKLIREAPGTYYHSVAVGNLAESAAEAIGADALLLRVASYYHDIGKTVRPYFFTDNQSNRENIHNELDPQTSASIIADHVIAGASMARAAKLPRQIVDIIMTHHGTSVISHFYQLALQQQDMVNIADFRYPGPRPQTREQAIMMLSDTVEATVRSKIQHGKIIVSKQTSTNTGLPIEELVNSIVDERVRSGQLDECPLTLQDLTRIKQAFVTTLQGIYHPRVEYAPQMIKPL